MKLIKNRSDLPQNMGGQKDKKYLISIKGNSISNKGNSFSYKANSISFIANWISFIANSMQV